MSKFRGRGNNFYNSGANMRSVNSLWLPPEDSDVPSPRPGTVRILALMLMNLSQGSRLSRCIFRWYQFAPVPK